MTEELSCLKAIYRYSYSQYFGQTPMHINCEQYYLICTKPTCKLKLVIYLKINHWLLGLVSKSLFDITRSSNRLKSIRLY